MVRLWTSGWELNPAGGAVEMEWGADDASGSAAQVRSGSYSGLVSTNTARIQFASPSLVDTWVYLSVYLYISAMPSGDQLIAQVYGSGAPLSGQRLYLDSSGVLGLESQSGSTLSTGQWYHFEWKLRVNSGAQYETESVFYLDGVEDMSTTVAHSNNGISRLTLNATDGTRYWDDCVLNDESGSFETGFSDHEVIHLHPNAAGDNAQWTPIPTVANYLNVDEKPPDDNTTYNFEATVGEIDDYNLEATPAALASDDDVPCVQVGIRYFSNEAAGTSDAQGKLRIKASSGGTVEESANLEVSSRYETHAANAPKTHQLTLYDKPGASTDPWTKSDLDSAQIGCKLTVNSQPYYWLEMSAIWLAVSHLPAVVAADRRRVLAQVA